MKRAIRLAVLLVASALVGYVAGAFQTGMEYDSFSHAEYALKKTGLPTRFAPSYCLHGFTGFRDYFEQTKFKITYTDDREALFSQMAFAKGWRVAPLTAEEYRDFQVRCMWSAVLDVPEDVVFDAWYYHASHEPADYSPMLSSGALAEIGQVGYGFEFAVYDAESGLFIFVDQFG